MSTIKLKSSDGEVFVIDVEVAKYSGTIRGLLQDFESMNMEDMEIPLANVNSKILKLVLKWSEQHKDDKSKDDDDKEKRTDDISQWDIDFMNVDQGILFELILAANYLDTKGLLEASCKTVANMIKGKTPEQIRKQFNIKNDLLPEEMDKIQEDNLFCE